MPSRTYLQRSILVFFVIALVPACGVFCSSELCPLKEGSCFLCRIPSTWYIFEGEYHVLSGNCCVSCIQFSYESLSFDHSLPPVVERSVSCHASSRCVFILTEKSQQSSG